MRKKTELHGDTSEGKTARLYRIWRGITCRCTNPNDKNFSSYGGRGISMCAEWRESYVSFKSWALSNGYTDNLSIDRIDNDRGYEPSNCRWATYHEQTRNRSNSKIATISGVTKTITEWAQCTGIPYSTLYRRFNEGVRGRELIAPKKQTIRQWWKACQKQLGN